MSFIKKKKKKTKKKTSRSYAQALMNRPNSSPTNHIRLQIFINSILVLLLKSRLRYSERESSMAVGAVAYVVMQKLTDMVDEEPVIFGKVMIDRKVGEIKKILGEMRDLLIDAEDKKVREYLRTFYDAEDAFESIFALCKARQRRRMGFLTNYALFFNNWRTAYCMMRRTGIEIKSLKKGVVQDASTKLSQQSGVSGQNLGDHEEEEEEEEEESDHVGDTMRSTTQVLRSLSDTARFREHLKLPKLMYSYSYDEQESRLVDFKKEVDTFVQRLTEQGSLGVVSIVGKVGSGKTALAHEIYKNRCIKQCFKCRAWVDVPKEHTKRDLILSVLKQVGDQKYHGALTSEQVLEDTLSRHLMEKRYLVVLDDVRDHHVWEKLKDAFPDNENGSKIVFTTREGHIATSADPHKLKPLSDQDSWVMFLNQAGFEECTSHSTQAGFEECSSHSTQAGFVVEPKTKQKFLKICKGLPLNIVLLGGLISAKKISSDDELLRVLNQVNSDILWLCYNDLLDIKKLCLLYLLLFPKEVNIPVRRLLRLWLAEGFVKKQSPNMVPEDVVQEYFEDLVNRKMIRISKLRSDGSPRKCRLPGVLHDYLLSKARDICLFHVRGNTAGADPLCFRRIVEYAGIENCTLNTSQLQHLRSYLSFNIQNKDTPAKEVGNFVSKTIGKRGFGLLRVLDLEGVYKPSLPDKLGDLVYLRYLGLRWTYLDILPQSIGNLPYLETLDLKHTNINSLPKSIGKLKHLRHLNLNEIHLDMPVQVQQRSSLTQLLTLWGLSVNDNSRVNNGLYRLLKLRELGITFNLSSCKDLVHWVANLTDLQSLRLRSKDDMGRPSKLSLEPLENLDKLSHMNLLGNLIKLPDSCNFPPNLKVLTLSVSKLKDDPMRTLGKLPNLTVLRLLKDSYCSTTMVCPRDGFGKLRVLKLWMLKELEEWDVEENAMQSLKELNIRVCPRLKNIPLRLLQLSTFEELILTNMPVEFTADIRKKKNKNTSLTINALDFTPLPWEQDGNNGGSVTQSIEG